MKNPHIRTELPGPKARALVERDARVVSPCYPRDCPFVMSHGRGVEVWDVDGNRFLETMQAGVLYVNRRAGATTGAWPGVQPFGGWKGSGSTGKNIGGLYTVQCYLREQSRTITG